MRGLIMPIILLFKTKQQQVREVKSQPVEQKLQKQLAKTDRFEERKSAETTNTKPTLAESDLKFNPGDAAIGYPENITFPKGIDPLSFKSPKDPKYKKIAEDWLKEEISKEGYDPHIRELFEADKHVKKVTVVKYAIVRNEWRAKTLALGGKLVPSIGEPILKALDIEPNHQGLLVISEIEKDGKSYKRFEAFTYGAYADVEEELDGNGNKIPDSGYIQRNNFSVQSDKPIDIDPKKISDLRIHLLTHMDYITRQKLEFRQALPPIVDAATTGLFIINPNRKMTGNCQTLSKMLYKAVERFE